MPWPVSSTIVFGDYGGYQLAGMGSDNIQKDDKFSKLEILYAKKKDEKIAKFLAEDLKDDFNGISVSFYEGDDD